MGPHSWHHGKLRSLARRAVLLGCIVLTCGAALAALPQEEEAAPGSFGLLAAEPQQPPGTSLRRNLNPPTVSRDDPPQKDQDPKLVKIGDLQRRYPFESLSVRLAYEKGRARAVPALPEEATRRLAAFETLLSQRLERPGRLAHKPERPWSDGELAFARRVTLSTLHHMSAEHFVTAEGFGYMRMPPLAAVRYLELAEAPPLPFPEPQESATSTAEGVPLSRLDAAPDANPPGMPSLGRLNEFHMEGELNFLNLAGFGYRKPGPAAGKDLLVAGFQAHQFRRLPELAPVAAVGPPPGLPKARWLIGRLELVGLLKQEEPVAYVSEHLPRMKDLQKAATRLLDAFEEDALRALRQGEDLVATANANRIRMLGALRAGKQCLDCHEAQWGELLGAFSYDLWRDPPLREP